MDDLVDLLMDTIEGLGKDHRSARAAVRALRNCLSYPRYLPIHQRPFHATAIGACYHKPTTNPRAINILRFENLWKLLTLHRLISIPVTFSMRQSFKILNRIKLLPTILRSVSCFPEECEYSCNPHRTPATARVSRNRDSLYVWSR
jgi:hypothetical protein